MTSEEFCEKINSMELNEKYTFATGELLDVAREKIRSSDMPSNRKEMLLETIDLANNLYPDNCYLKLGILELLVNAIMDVLADKEHIMALATVIAFHEIIKFHSEKIETTVSTLTFLVKSQEDELKSLREEIRFLKESNNGN